MIGIFDSGSGGLTVLKAIRDRMPSADVVYFGDIAHAPYGSRSREELSVFTVQAIQLLQEKGANNIVSACNSVSASLAVSLFDVFGLGPTQLVEMVGPTVRPFRGSSARILVCATPATVQSGIYQNAFRMIGKDVEMLAMPQLASAIEFGEPDEAIRSSIAGAFAPVDSKAFDVVLLCCTHYPLVTGLFEEVLQGLPLVLVDPAEAVAERVEKLWWPQEAGSGFTRLLITKDSGVFRRRVETMFPEMAHSVEVVEQGAKEEYAL